ncbi:MAG: hypothetical protein GW903_02635 [Alphaproteobacteria bacterium]|nr:hypothetical protein [Alphaproteobacteria bacterium]NCQ87869.1 hypothetical protein [Alphaproteobacteria bacterium]NCT05623.1 hypothetical protein [Alphaproteobacteria bacterium]
MSVVRKGNKEIPSEKKPVIYTIKSAAILFIITGLGGFIFPDAYMKFLAFDSFILNIFSGSLVAIALIEYFIIPKILLNTNTGN